MDVVTRLVRRLLPALLMAASVTLLAAGVFNWAPPRTLGDIAFPTPSPAASGTPSVSPTPTPSRPTTPSGGVSNPPASVGASPSATTAADSPPTRLVVPSLGIDLPVVPGSTDYPLCNVAQYLFGFANPGQPGTTYLYGHARAGMLLPLLDASGTNDGAAMIGALVEVYTADLKRHDYQINIVKPHATDLTLAYELAPGEH